MRPQRKVFAYVVRRAGADGELVVFDSLGEPGAEVPRGMVESEETLEAAVRRELLEEAGLSAIRVLAELGATRYRDEQQHFFRVEPIDALPDAFAHVVTGHDSDAGFTYAFRWSPIDERLGARFVQGCGTSLFALVRRRHRR